MADEKVIPVAYTKISIDQESGGVFTSCTFPTLNLTSESIDVFTSEGKGEKIHTNSILTFGDVTLTRGVTDNKTLHDWAITLAQSRAWTGTSSRSRSMPATTKAVRS